MNTLAVKLAERIAQNGPLTIEDYMTACLLDPEHGYYTTRDPFGAPGDFITAPEISQMFGELIGLWALMLWMQAGEPSPAKLVELGPGRGTLMADALRAIESATKAHAPFDVHLVEASPTLRKRQNATLGDRAVHWHDRLEDVPGDTPRIVIANEFFDALPIRQLVATPQGWRERMVDVVDDRLQARLSDEPATASLTEDLPDGKTGQVAEAAPSRNVQVARIAEDIVRHGGAALLIDFTDDALPLVDTFQAVRSHSFADRFDNPGEADLASAVDFSAFAQHTRSAGAVTHGPVCQGLFLQRLGIIQRAGSLKAKATPEQATDMDTAVDRLVSTDGMGRDFRVMALTAPGWPRPEGFGGTQA